MPELRRYAAIVYALIVYRDAPMPNRREPIRREVLNELRGDTAA